jgi:hypothetical protein
MAFSTKTKLRAAGALVAGGLIFAGAEHAGYFDEHPYAPTLTGEATDALHNGGKGFNTLFLDKQKMARPITATIIDQAVEIMMTDMGDHSPQAHALGQCSIALANELWQTGTGKVRQEIIKETADFSFENGAVNMPPDLGDNCRQVNVELLPHKTEAFFPVPSE